MTAQEKIKLGRDFCKSPFGEEREPSDQQKRLPQPPLCKAPVSDDIIPLTDTEEWSCFDGIRGDGRFAEYAERIRKFVIPVSQKV